MFTQRALVITAVVLASVVVTTAPALANVGTSQSLTMPAAAAVGQQNINGSVTVINTNTPPHQSESNTINSLRLAPSCGATGTAANPCPTPDPGVFAVNSANGSTGTACAGITFTMSAPDASGIVTFNPSSSVVLAPPGGPAGSDRCTVDFTFGVLKIPTIDADAPTAGVQTRANFVSRVTSSPSGLSPTPFSSLVITVTKASPTVASQASPGVAAGGTISDTATVTGVSGIPAPTGTVFFQVFGPNNATCSSSSAFQSTNALSPAGPTSSTATSNGFQVTQPGTYRWIASYSGDANYHPVVSPCNAPNESVVVSPRATITDFDGNGNTDIAVFRPSGGTWFVRNGVTVNWGTSGDIPVPGDYDGNGTTNIAVFRPSDGTWFVQGGATVAWGTSGDIPVPGDYDGNGTTDIAVFRPSGSTWFVRNGVTANWGTSGDIPVPGDYDGNGTIDIAVFRPSVGTWFVKGVVTTGWGTSTDVALPLATPVRMAFFP